jgi:hypothetical protein
MSRALILIAAVLLLREFLPRHPRRSPTTISPYMNSLDSLMSAQQVSLVMDELRLHESSLSASQSSKHPPATAA